MKALAGLFLTITLFSITLSAKELNTEIITDKMIEVYGGEKSIKAASNYEQVWHIETKTTDKNGTDYRKVAMPDFLRTELVYPDKREIRVMFQGYGTKQFGKTHIQAQGPMLDAMKLQLMRIYNPLVLKNKINDITLFEDEKYYILSLKKGSVTAEYFVSRDSYLVEKVIGRLKMGSHSMEFLTLYRDYKSVDGMMLAHTEIKYAGNVNTAIMRLKEMKLISASKRSIN